MATHRESLLEVDFSYLADPKLRDIVQQFHKEALAAFNSGLFVATVVLLGGVLEGILAFALMGRQAEAQQKFRQKHSKKADDRPSPADWYLSELIEIAWSMKLIGETARGGAWAVKDFRNLIHPCTLVTRSPPRWRALAMGALAAIEDISASLGGRLRDLEPQP